MLGQSNIISGPRKAKKNGRTQVTTLLSSKAKDGSFTLSAEQTPPAVTLFYSYFLPTTPTPITNHQHLIRTKMKMNDAHPSPASSSTSPAPDSQMPQTSSRSAPTDCLSCRIIGTGALGATGMYALNQARAHQPGSVIGKRIMAGVGVLFLLGSVARWRA
jgi:Domain of unknown function (DUF4536)